MKKDEIKQKKIAAKKRQADQEGSFNEHENGGRDQLSGEPKIEDDKIKHEAKLEADTQKKRFEYENMEYDDERKWTYLEHHGVVFPDPYKPRNLTIDYNGHPVKLTAFQEELAWFWVETLGSERENDKYYRKNFSGKFMERFIKEKTPYTDFDKFDFTPVKIFREEEKKKVTDEDKLKAKERKKEQDRLYGYAIVDDLVQKISAIQIEPPTLFKGRGENPKAGLLKARVQPEDVTLNMALDAPIPKCPMKGHSWGEIVNKQDSTWLCSYKVEKEGQNSSKKEHKYIFLAANSMIKGRNDWRKYEKARALKQKIFDIRENYYKKIVEKDLRDKQLGVATYLIDTLALRVGNQKGDDEADTVGCCSLRVQHIENLPDNQIKLDFLGKDSMRYENIVTVKQQVWKAIEIFRRNKSKGQDLFDKIDAQILNDYLKSMMPGLTAKVFRTYNASTTLQKQLKKADLTGLTMQQKREAYDAANIRVAILCNHQKTVSKKQVESLKHKEKRIDAMKQYLKELQNHIHKFSSKKGKIERESEVVEVQGCKPIIKKFPETKEASESLLKKESDKLLKEQRAFHKKEETKQIATGTSKTNYNDPRISVAWCKKNEVKIEKIFTKNLLSKFLWAMWTEMDWQF